MEDLPRPLIELRRQARRLLNQARQGEPAALARCLRLRGFAGVAPAELPARVRLKHALAALAEDAGFESWLAAKTALLATGSEMTMWEPSLSPLLNRWFARYDEARASLEEGGGYLLPFRTQFFVCEAEGVRLLGLDPADPDWAAIGHDWVRPRDLAAWVRLRKKRRAASQP